MTIGIYSITHITSGKRYIGKSVNVESRLWQHRNLLSKPERSKDCNRHLWNAVKKYGWEAFQTEIIERFTEIDEELIAERELYWMDEFRTCEREHGYNLRRDSSTRMIVHEETRKLYSEATQGERNPNFGNFWTDEQKQKMSEIALGRHRSGEFYGDEWRRKQSEKSIKLWSDPEKRHQVSLAVSATKQQANDFLQYDRSGKLLRRWHSIEQIVAENPGYKWQNIYSVCNGYKPTYMGFIWRKMPAATFDALFFIAVAA